MSAYSSQIVMAFIVSFLAGLFTILGALVLFIKPIRKNNIVFVVYGNLFAAGAMIFVSLCEILQVKSVGAMLAHFCPDYSEECHSKHYGKTLGICYSLFFAGCVFCFAVNSLAHALLNRSENLFLRYDPDRNPETDEDMEKQKKEMKSFCLMGLSTCVALALHNIPEGLVTFVTTYNDTGAGITLAIAIAVHNIPEGIAIAVPVFFATKSMKKAFLFVLIASIAEPIGGMIGFALIHTGIGRIFEAISFGICAGIMVWVVISDMLPISYHYAASKTVSATVFCVGALVMALSLILLNL